MSVRQGLLVLLSERPRHGYELRSEFEQRTGSMWSINIGQVYTTLRRLERDGLVESLPPEPDGTVPHRITTRGLAAVASWWSDPVVRDGPVRDELAIKVALAVSTPGIDPDEIVAAQRSECHRMLDGFRRQMQRFESRASEDDLTSVIIVDSLIFHAEAELRWLDHVEARIRLRSTNHGFSAAADPYVLSEAASGFRDRRDVLERGRTAPRRSADSSGRDRT